PALRRHEGDRQRPPRGGPRRARHVHGVEVDLRRLQRPAPEGPDRQPARLTRPRYRRPVRHSAGLLLYRAADGDGIEVLIAHPGGPFWAAREAGAWSIPKGEIEDGEDPLAVARREFEEETGHPAPPGAHWPLGDVRLRSGKMITGWAARGDLDPSMARSNEIDVEWPPRSGRRI